MNITPDPKNDMKIEIRNTQCTLIYSSYSDFPSYYPINGLSTYRVHTSPGWLSDNIDSPQYYGILYSNRIFLEKLTFFSAKTSIGIHLKNWYVEIVDKNNNWIEVCKGLSPGSTTMNIADINKPCYGFRIVCLDTYYNAYPYKKGLNNLIVYGEIIFNNSLFTNNNIYGYTE